MKKKTIQRWLMVAGCVCAAVVLSGCASTSLGRAAAHGDVTEIERQIAAGADVNKTGIPDGKSPLMWAAYNGKVAAVKVLLDNGASIGLKALDGTGYTAAEYAQRRGYIEIAELINTEPQRRKEIQAKVAGDQMAEQLKTASLIQLLQKYPMDNEFVVAALTDALVEAETKQLPEFLLTASYDEKQDMQVAVKKQLIQATVALQQCNNEAQGFAEQGNTQKATECRNLATSLLGYQAALNAIKTELEK